MPVRLRQFNVLADSDKSSTEILNCSGDIDKLDSCESPLASLDLLALAKMKK